MKVINLEDSSNTRSKRYKQTALGMTLAILVGAGSGFVATIFQIFLDFIFYLRNILIHSKLTEYIPWEVIAFFMGAILAAIGYFLVISYAQESGGSGVPEIEGALEDKRPVRWKRVLPVKFIGCLGTLGSGMMLGREGPSIQIGANLAKMFTDIFKIKSDEITHASLAVGASAGLTAAFNAPLASVVFIMEEMRYCFKYTILSISMVTAGVISSDIVYRLLMGQGPVSVVHIFNKQSIESLWLYVVFGIFIGFCGYLFNRFIFKVIALFKKFYKYKKYRFVLVGFILGGTFGILLTFNPGLSKGGLDYASVFLSHKYSIAGILSIFVLRFILASVCFGSGAPGGIFAPLLSVGTVAGVSFGMICSHLFNFSPTLGAVLGIIGMGALFGSTIRAPITGIILVLEITANYNLILPMLITTLTGYMVSRIFDTKPLYTAILRAKLSSLNEPVWKLK
ncbi:MAG: H(+)/Cl(-) exchange transporter ClcA [Psittacicella sp.]